MLGMQTRLGAVINMSLVRELGPVWLRRCWPPGRQFDGRRSSACASPADRRSGVMANPVHYLVVPRFLGCLVLIRCLRSWPTSWAWSEAISTALTSSTSIPTLIENSAQFVGKFDFFSGIFKSFFFRAAIALIGCHRGFNCDAGAEGVGRAATEAFVYSFVVILFLDLMLGIGLEKFYSMIWPQAPSLF